MAVHAKTRYDDSEQQRQQSFNEAEALRIDLTRLTQKVAELTRECARRYTPQQHDEAKQQATNEHDAKLSALRAEMQNLLNVSNTELTRYKGLLTTVQQEAMATAISTDAASAQAQFIRQLREKCEALANERDTYRRNAEDYVTQLSRADETVQQNAAEHYDHMAAARHEANGLRSQILAATDVHKQQVTENVRLTSNVTQLREEVQTQNAMIETMNLTTVNENKRNEEVNQRLRNTADETARELNARLDPAEQQEQVDRHTSEMATAKTKYGHHVTELTAQLGDLQAENTQLSDDLGWFQEKGRARAPPRRRRG